MAKEKKDSKKEKKDSKKEKKDSKKEKKDSKKSLALGQMPRTSQLPKMRFNDVLTPKSLPTWFSGESELWTPAIHVQEKENKFVAKFELPGVNEEDIGISVVGDKLIVQGEKKAESEVEKKGYFYRETSYGSFYRTITIPSIVDTELISANFDKGVLEIDLPKIVGIQPKKVNVIANKKAKAIGKETEIASSAREANLPKTVGIPSKTDVMANKEAKPIGKESGIASNPNPNSKTGKSEGQSKA